MISHGRHFWGRFCAALLLGTVSLVASAAVADDLFGEGEAATDEAEPASEGGAKELLGGLLGSTTEPSAERRNGQWDDITTEGSAESDIAYEQSLEVKMHRELSKELPTREPFGDQLEDVEKRLGK